jgi:hypothetical protein
MRMVGTPRGYQDPPRGYAYYDNGLGQLIVAPASPNDYGMQGQHGLGQHPQEFADAIRSADDDYSNFEKVPAFYTVSLDLGGDDNAVAGSSTPLRPEPFVCRRVTWATTGDTPAFTASAAGGSAQGRAVEVSFEDEFTKFLGLRPSLVSALFGDSQGYLDLPRRGLLFQGKQTLSISLRRILWPDSSSDPATTRWDFSFQGFGLLPKGVHQSGSAG